MNTQILTPKVSVIIPVYNIGEVVAQMLDSILVQTEQSFEVICINDGSTDNGKTLSVLEAYAHKDSRIHVITRTNAGPGATRDYGLSLARAPFCYVCDQDDILHPQLFEYCLWALEQYDAEFIAFRWAAFTSNNFPKIERLPENFKQIPILIADEKTRQNAPAQYVKAHEIHVDHWVHFSTTTLARQYSFSQSIVRPWAIIQMSSRWLVSEATLYFYNVNQVGSMSRSKISEKTIQRFHEQYSILYELYAKERIDGDPVGLWVFINQHVAMVLKQIYNRIRRSKDLGKTIRTRQYQALTNMLYDFFFIKEFSFRAVRIQHKLAYLWLILRFKVLARHK